MSGAWVSDRDALAHLSDELRAGIERDTAPLRAHLAEIELKLASVGARKAQPFFPESTARRGHLRETENSLNSLYAEKRTLLNEIARIESRHQLS